MGRFIDASARISVEDPCEGEVGQTKPECGPCPVDPWALRSQAGYGEQEGNQNHDCDDVAGGVDDAAVTVESNRHLQGDEGRYWQQGGCDGESK